MRKPKDVIKGNFKIQLISCPQTTATSVTTTLLFIVKNSGKLCYTDIEMKKRFLFVVFGGKYLISVSDAVSEIPTRNIVT